MKNLFLRSNILKREAFDKSVFIYEDHRYVLNIIYSGFKSGTLTEPVTVIYFDQHDDGRDSKADTKLLQNYRQNLPDEKEFWSFVEWDLTENDSDWLKTGMEIGLIGDAILIGCKEATNFPDFENKYSDHAKVDHTIFNVTSIWGGLANQGWLVDTAQRQKFNAIWDLLGWDNRTTPCQFDTNKKKTKFIVDFDLDCFTTELESYTIPWPIEYMEKLFYRSSQRCFLTAKSFMHNLIRESEFVTIARETDYCGSIKNNNRILDNLNEVVFDHNL